MPEYLFDDLALVPFDETDDSHRPANVAQTEVNPQPRITEYPEAMNVIVGSPITLAVAANGYGSPLAYQWRLNGMAISGVTSASISVSSRHY